MKYAYYIPELNLIFDAPLDKYDVFYVFIYKVGEYVPFDAVLLGAI